MQQQLVNYLGLLYPIPAADEETISSYFEPRSCKEGAILYPGNGICTELYFICSGILRIFSYNDKGVEITYYFYKENQLCTILPGFTDGSKAEAGIRAACDAEVLVISRNKMDALCGKLPYIKELMEQIHQQRVMEKLRTRHTYIGEDAETQYKLFVMSQPDIALRVPVKDIASYLGITPQSLSRIRKNIR